MFPALGQPRGLSWCRGVDMVSPKAPVLGAGSPTWGADAGLWEVAGSEALLLPPVQSLEDLSGHGEGVDVIGGSWGRGSWGGPWDDISSPAPSSLSPGCREGHGFLGCALLPQCPPATGLKPRVS